MTPPSTGRSSRKFLITRRSLRPGSSQSIEPDAPVTPAVPIRQPGDHDALQQQFGERLIRLNKISDSSQRDAPDRRCDSAAARPATGRHQVPD